MIVLEHGRRCPQDPDRVLAHTLTSRGLPGCCPEDSNPLDRGARLAPSCPPDPGALDTLHPTLYILRPAPHTLHPTPCAQPVKTLQPNLPTQPSRCCETCILSRSRSCWRHERLRSVPAPWRGVRFLMSGYPCTEGLLLTRTFLLETRPPEVGPSCQFTKHQPTLCIFSLSHSCWRSKRPR